MLRLDERLAGRLSSPEQWMADTALKKVSARLASFLIRLLEKEVMVDRECVRDKHPLHPRAVRRHESVARRGAVSRAMGELRRLGAVEVKGRRVYMRDENTLRRAAEIIPQKP